MLSPKRILNLALCAALLAGLACGKKCQQPPSQPFPSITSSQWRLVSTSNTNPRYQNINNYTFEIWTFNLDETGSVTKVFNNDQCNSPSYSMTYSVNSTGSSGQLGVTFTNLAPSSAANVCPPAQNSSSGTSGSSGISQPTTGTGGSTTSPQVQYSYSLSNELDLTDSQGFSYRFVPYTGIIAPDLQCTF